MKTNISIPLNIPIKKFLILFSAVVFTISCSTNVVLTKEAKSSINAVSVSEKVIIPEKPIIESNSGNNEAISTLFMIIFAAADALININKDDPTNKLLDDIVKIDLSKNLREYFIAQLNENKIFNIVIDEANKENKPDAEFILVISSYGLHKKPSFFLSRYRAEICLKGGLILNPPYKTKWDTNKFYEIYRYKFSDGIQDSEKHPVLWQTDICGYSTDSYRLGVYMQKPEKLEEVFTEAMKDVVEKLFKDLKSD
jgi:hypothetical protein